MFWILLLCSAMGCSTSRSTNDCLERVTIEFALHDGTYAQVYDFVPCGRTTKFYPQTDGSLVFSVDTAWRKNIWRDYISYRIKDRIALEDSALTSNQ